MTPEQWFERFGAELPAVLPVVSEDERAALLDLARIAAHSSERWAAPITTFLAGVAFADREPAARARSLRQLADALEPPG